MTVQARLQKATQALTPHQRAVLVLQALREGREPDPEVRKIEDPVQNRVFNRYMALLWVINHHLGAVGKTIFFRVEVVEDAVYNFRLFSNAATMMEEIEGLTNVKGHKNWRELKREISATELMKSLALEVKERGVQYLLHLWKETCSLQLVREDLAAEFEGEDPLLPEPRHEAGETRRRLLAAADALGVRKRLVDGDEEFVGLYQAEVNESFRHLGLVEPYA